MLWWHCINSLLVSLSFEIQQCKYETAIITLSIRLVTFFHAILMHPGRGFPISSVLSLVSHTGNGSHIYESLFGTKPNVQYYLTVSGLLSTTAEEKSIVDLKQSYRVYIV